MNLFLNSALHFYTVRNRREKKWGCGLQIAVESQNNGKGGPRVLTHALSVRRCGDKNSKYVLYCAEGQRWQPSTCTQDEIGSWLRLLSQ